MKTSAIVRLVIYAVVAVMLTVLLCGVLLCREWLPQWMQGWSVPGLNVHYKDSDSYQTGAADLSEPVTQIDVHWIAGRVDIHLYDGDTVTWKEESGQTLNEEEVLRYRVENGKLTIQFCAPIRFSWNWNLNKSLTLQIPRSLSGLKTLSVETASASVEIRDVTADEIGVTVVSGESTLTNVSCRSLDMDSVSGNCTAEGRFEEVDGDAVSAEMTVRSSRCPSEVSVETVSGDIALTVPENDGFVCEHDTVSGSLNVDFPTTTKKGRATYKNGTAKFSFDTVSGDVYVYKAA